MLLPKIVHSCLLIFDIAHCSQQKCFLRSTNRQKNEYKDTYIAWIADLTITHQDFIDTFCDMIEAGY